jgi:hypothetical protein
MVAEKFPIPQIKNKSDSVDSGKSLESCFWQNPKIRLRRFVFYQLSGKIGSGANCFFV